MSISWSCSSCESLFPIVTYEVLRHITLCGVEDYKLNSRTQVHEGGKWGPQPNRGLPSDQFYRPTHSESSGRPCLIILDNLPPFSMADDHSFQQNCRHDPGDGGKQKVDTLAHLWLQVTHNDISIRTGFHNESAGFVIMS